jgi:hypothetical protein
MRWGYYCNWREKLRDNSMHLVAFVWEIYCKLAIYCLQHPPVFAKPH